MPYFDKEIVCKDCGSSFVWSASEQEFFAQKGLTNTPGRCPICRKKVDVKHEYQNLYDLKCKDCGKEAKSPLQPDDFNEVLCQACFDKISGQSKEADETSLKDSESSIDTPASTSLNVPPA